MKGVIFCKQEELSSILIDELEKAGIYVETLMQKEALVDLPKADLDFLFIELPFPDMDRGSLFKILKALWEKGIYVIILKKKDYPVREADRKNETFILLETSNDPSQIRENVKELLEKLEKKAVPSLQEEMILNPLYSLNEITHVQLSPEEAFIYSSLDGKTPVKKLYSILPYPEETVKKAAEKFLKLKLVKVKEVSSNGGEEPSSP